MPDKKQDENEEKAEQEKETDKPVDEEQVRTHVGKRVPCTRLSLSSSGSVVLLQNSSGF